MIDLSLTRKAVDSLAKFDLTSPAAATIPEALAWGDKFQLFVEAVLRGAGQ